MKYLSLLILIVFAACSTPNSNGTDETTSEVDSSAQAQESNEGVFFKNIGDLDTLVSPFVVEMGVKGMIVEPKGPVKEGYGHHHLLINDKYFEEGLFIAADSTHIHYGAGQEVDTVNLAPGKYFLTLQFANGMHISYGEKWSKSITVIVK